MAVPLRPDLAHPDRLLCEGLEADRPALPASYAIDWNGVYVAGDALATLRNAQAEHEAYVRAVLARNGIVSAWLVKIEGQLFVCSSNMQWWRDYWRALPAD